MPTPQETFDHVVRSLIAQGRPSQGPEGECVYLADDGCKCAAGHCIPPHKYDKSFEGILVEPIVVIAEAKREKHKQLLDALDGHDIKLVSELQGAHDLAPPDSAHFLHGDHDRYGFLDRARRVAKAFQLDASACDAAPVPV